MKRGKRECGVDGVFGIGRERTRTHSRHLPELDLTPPPPHCTMSSRRLCPCPECHPYRLMRSTRTIRRHIKLAALRRHEQHAKRKASKASISSKSSRPSARNEAIDLEMSFIDSVYSGAFDCHDSEAMDTVNDFSGTSLILICSYETLI